MDLSSRVDFSSRNSAAMSSSSKSPAKDEEDEAFPIPEAYVDDGKVRSNQCSPKDTVLSF